LEDLRRIAVEGMTSSSVVSAAGNQGGKIKGEGEYVSMPLEGRMDLMRPRKEEPVVVMTVEEMGSRSEKKKEPPQLYLTERLADEEEAAQWPESFATPVWKTVGLSGPANAGLSHL
jgi:hypothetical protein